MSDFLSNLLSRHDQPKSAVRPRLPSLFENEARRESPVTELTVETEAPIMPPAPRRTADLPVAPTPQAPVAAATMPLPRQETATSANPPVEASKPAAVLQTRVEHETSVFTSTATEPVSAPRPDVVRPDVVRIEAGQPGVEPRSEHHIHEIERRVEREMVPGAHRTIEKAQVQSPAPAIMPAPRPTMAETRMPPPPFATAREERPVARETRRREARETPAPSAPEPTIQISIGRIEIKAMEERDKPARKTDKPSSVMTLDEYLRSRAKR